MDAIFEVMESEGFITWLLISSVVLLGGLIILFVAIRAFCYYQIDELDGNYDIDKIAKKIALKPYEVAQAVFEVVIANTCIIVMMCIYYWITEKLDFLNEFFSIILLVLIVIAVIANNMIDNKLDQNMLEKSDKAMIRLISSLSIIIILGYIKIKFVTSQYDVNAR